ncbi:hypothetical protein U1Q18_002236, partial [Sarracenia purpurea var. burkii]
MDCVIIEIYDIYRRICKGICNVMGRICSVWKKSTLQGEELYLYLEFYRDIDVLNLGNCSKVERMPEESIQEVKRIINGDSKISEMKNKAIVMSEAPTMDDQMDSWSYLKTLLIL